MAALFQLVVGYEDGTQVTITATPSSGFVFMSWSVDQLIKLEILQFLRTLH